MCIKLFIPAMEILKLPKLPIQATCCLHLKLFINISSYSNIICKFSFYKFIKEWNALSSS